MIFVIVLVGCLNVGKFILFNCLMYICDVLVVDFFGLMCDCKYGCVEVEGYEFIVIDIGGIDGIEDGVEIKMVG